MRARDEARRRADVEHVVGALDQREAEHRGRLLEPERRCRAATAMIVLPGSHRDVDSRSPSARRPRSCRSISSVVAAGTARDVRGSGPRRSRRRSRRGRRRSPRRRRAGGDERAWRLPPSAVPSPSPMKSSDRPRAAVAAALVAPPERVRISSRRRANDLDARRRAAPACPRRCSAARRRPRCTIVSKNVSTTRSCAVVVV